MKQLIVFISIILGFVTNQIFSQYDFDGEFNFDIGFNFGGTGYLGDIGGKEEIGKRFLGDIILKQTNIASGIFTRYKINSKININSGLNYVKISGDDANSTGPENNYPRGWRNLRFQNQIYELNSSLEYTFFRINNLGIVARNRTSLNLYAFIGGSVFYHNPKGAFLKNANSPIKEWVSLRPLKTEGQIEPYSRIGISTPFGLGAIIKTRTFYKFGIYFRYMKNYTDYLDDVSNVYAYNPGEGPGEGIANQYNGPEGTANSFSEGDIRGNPKYNDDIFMLNFTFSKVILSKKNIFYKDYLIKYIVPKKLQSKRKHVNRNDRNFQIKKYNKRKKLNFKNFKKKKSKRTRSAKF